MKALLFIAVMFLVPAAHAAEGAFALPEIGDPSSAVLSPEDQRRIGESVMRSIRRSDKLFDDREVSSYLADLGHRLAAQGDFPRSGLTFFAVEDPSINAFALPGGFIGIHTGLITASRSEAELASVVAHEISHVTQNHIARGLEKAQRTNLPMMAALLTALVLGGDNPEVAEAALATAAAGSSQTHLDYTRRHEHEADRIGMQLLAGAGLDPAAMPDFFERLQRDSRFRSNAAPEFLRTHPVTTSRIADSRGRAAQMESGGRALDPQRYALIQAKVRALTDEAPGNALKRIEASLSDEPDDPVLIYEQALLLKRDGRLEEAIDLLEELQDDGPRIAFGLALAETHHAAARYEQAVAVYETMLELYPGNVLLTMGYADSLLKAGRADRASRVLARMVRSPEETPEPEIYRLLAETEAARGNAGGSHLAMARYYHRLGDISSALTQLGLAKQEDLDYYQKAQVQAFSDELEEMRNRTKDDK